MAGVSVVNRNGTIVVDVDRRTPNPIDEVLKMLGGAHLQAPRTFVDMTSVKPNRFQDGDIRRLLDALPRESGRTYIVGLDERMVDRSEAVAREYAETLPYVNRPTYIVAAKESATRIAFQRAT